MVQNIISIDEREDRVLNMVKAKFGLKNKSEAVALVTRTYEESFLEPVLRPEFIEKMKKRAKQPSVKVDDFKRHFGLK